MSRGTDAADGRWSRRRFVGVLGGAAAASALAGCGSGSAGGSPDAEQAPQAAPPQQPSASASTASTPQASPSPSGPRPLYVGTYTSAEGGGKGIGVASYDPGSGRITGRGTITGVPDPSYLAVHPNGR